MQALWVFLCLIHHCLVRSWIQCLYIMGPPYTCFKQMNSNIVSLLTHLFKCILVCPKSFKLISVFGQSQLNSELNSTSLFLATVLLLMHPQRTYPLEADQSLRPD